MSDEREREGWAAELQLEPGAWRAALGRSQQEVRGDHSCWHSERGPRGSREKGAREVEGARARGRRPTPAAGSMDKRAPPWAKFSAAGAELQPRSVKGPEDLQNCVSADCS